MSRIPVAQTIQRTRRVLKDPGVLIRKLAHVRYMRQYDGMIVRNLSQNPEKSNTVIMASFPKSGSTWLRFVFANLIGLSELGAPTIDYHRLDEMMPSDAFEKDLTAAWPYQTLPCILRTNYHHRPVYDRFRRIFLYRNPLDVMVSAYFYFTNRVGPASAASDQEKSRMELKPYSGTPSEFLRLALDGWCLHYRSWMNRSSVTISYEELKSEPVLAVGNLLDGLGIEIEESVVQEAVERSDIRRIQKLEDESGLSDKMANLNGKFARSGEVAQWRAHFDEEDLNFCYRRLEEFNIPVESLKFSVS